MAQFHIRDISEEDASKIDAIAQAAGVSREAWLRELIVNATKQPLIKDRYAIRVYGVAGKGLIKRYGGDDPNCVGGGSSGLSTEEFAAYQKAEDYVRRNGAGDREKAFGLLHEAFGDGVFEVPV